MITYPEYFLHWHVMPSNNYAFRRVRGCLEIFHAHSVITAAREDSITFTVKANAKDGTVVTVCRLRSRVDRSRAETRLYLALEYNHR